MNLSAKEYGAACSSSARGSRLPGRNGKTPDRISVTRPSQAQRSATHGGAGVGRAGASGGSGGGKGDRNSSADTEASVVRLACVFHDASERVASRAMTEVDVKRVDSDETCPTEVDTPAEPRAGRGALVWVLPAVALVV